jgi:two-component system, response regulator PdtaR
MSQSICVLVVEDEPLLRIDIADQLSDAGYEVLEASNAAEAIELLEKTPSIRLVFTDIDMPGSMDGLALAAAVANRWPPVEIIVTSGHRIVDIVDLPDGSMFFSKPYRAGDIIRSMHELLA